MVGCRRGKSGGEEDVQDKEEHEPKEEEQLGKEGEEDESRGKRIRRKGTAWVGIA